MEKVLNNFIKNYICEKYAFLVIMENQIKDDQFNLFSKNIYREKRK